MAPHCRISSLYISIAPLRDRLTVGRQALNLVIMVRIHVSEQMS